MDHFKFERLIGYKRVLDSDVSNDHSFMDVLQKIGHTRGDILREHLDVE